MKSVGSKLNSLLCAVAAAGLFHPALAQIGTVQFVAGEVLITGPAGSRPANRGATFREGESIVTGANSSAQVRMIDQGYIAVRPETEMKFDQYRFTGREDGSERSIVSLVKGGFRTITGAIGRLNRNTYTVNTPTSTVGIRGTDHEVIHVVAAPARPPGPVGNIDPIQFASVELVLTDFGMINLAQAAAVPIPAAGPGIPAGSYNRVNVGATVMRTDVAVLNLNRNQVGYAAARNEPPRFAPPGVVNQLFTTTARPGQPQKPAAQQSQQQGQQGQQGQQQGQQQSQAGQAGAASTPAQQSAAPAPQAAGEPTPVPAPAPAPATEPIRTVTVVDNPSQIAAGVSNSASAAPSAQSTTVTTVIAPTPGASSSESSSSSSSGSTAGSSTTSSTVPITLTSSSGLTVNTTSQTVTTASGSTASIAQSAFATLAQEAATLASQYAQAAQTASTTINTPTTGVKALALAAQTSLAAVTAVSAATAQTQAASIDSSVNTATGTLTAAVAALAPVNVSAANANASSASTTFSGVNTAFNAADAARTARGIFADPQSGTAKTGAQAVLGLASTASSQAQTAATNVATLNASVTAKQTLANADLSAARTALSTAQGFLANVATQNTTISSAQTSSAGFVATANSAGSNAATSASVAAVNASAAQTTAAAALTYQNANDLTNAQAQLTLAQQLRDAALAAKTAAETALNSANSAKSSVQNLLSSAQTAQSTASTQLVSAQSSLTSAVAAGTTATATHGQGATDQISAGLALTDTATQLAIVNTNAPLVTAAIPKIYYRNPANANTLWSHSVQTTRPFTAPGTAGVELVLSQTNTFGSRQSYVLDQNNNLVNLRNSADLALVGGTGPSTNPNIAAFGHTYTAQAATPGNSIAFASGTQGSEGSFISPDDTVYMGRWQGGAMNVTGATPTSINLGANSAHWSVFLQPLPTANTFSFHPGVTNTSLAINSMMTLVGNTTYNKVYNTTPTDSAGNLGTLNSASLSANFSARTVNTSVNLDIAGRNLVSSASNIPMSNDGFDAGFGATVQPTVVCTPGTGSCNANGYAGSLSGGFAGLVTGNGAGLVYSVRGNSTGAANLGWTEVIQGQVAFAAGATPSVGLNPNFPNNTRLRHRLLYPTTLSSGPDMYFANAGANANPPGLPNPATGSPNFNYLFDASGNLVRIQATNYAMFDQGTPVSSITPPAAPRIPNLNAATVSFGDGTFVDAQEDVPTSQRLGRWSGGNVRYMDLNNNTLYIDTLGARSAHWYVGQIPTTLPVSGSYTFERITDGGGNNVLFTPPTDAYGNVGTLNTARLRINFMSMRVTPGLRISINAGPGGAFGVQNLFAYATAIPLTGGSFNVSSNPASNAANTDFLHVSCSGTGCAPSTNYGGRMEGALAGDVGGFSNGAFFRYTLSTGYATQAAADAAQTGRLHNDYIDGLVAFKQGPATGSTSLVALVQDMGAGGSVGRLGRYRSESFTTLTALDTFGNTTTFAADDKLDENVAFTLALTGGTPNGGGSASGPAQNRAGVTYGVWNNPGLTLNGKINNNTLTNATTFGPLHWIRGGEIYPFYITNTLTGTATFGFDGSAPGTLPRDKNGMSGTIGSASLTVDFGRQALSANATLSLAANPANGGTLPRNWAFTANDIRLNRDSTFNAFVNTDASVAAAHKLLAVSLNGNGASTFGQIDGSLFNIGLSGAGLAYTLGGNDVNNSNQFELVTGTLAFHNNIAGGRESTTAPYYPMLFARGLNAGAAPIDEDFLARVDENINPQSAVSFDGNGVPIAFDFRKAVIISPTCTPPCQQSVSGIPVSMTLGTASIASGASIIAGATLPESGKDVTSGIFWGRYGGGAFNMTDKISNTSAGTFDVSGQPFHMIGAGPATSLGSLPISGIFNYNAAVFGTNPTDNTGRTATSATHTLSANFTNKTVDWSTSIVMPAGGSQARPLETWAASATAMPILKDTVFFAFKKSGSATTPPLTINVNGSPTNTGGTVAGVFVGANAPAAITSFSLNQGGVTGATVSGVAGFRR